MDRSRQDNYNFSVPPPNFQQGAGSARGGRNDSWPDRTSADTQGQRNSNYGKVERYGGEDKSNAEMVIQDDTIFVSGMNPDITEVDIQAHFGAIGIIKKDKRTMKPKIWLYKHKDTGVSKGEATVTYDDTNAAQAATSWFDGREFNGCVIKVTLAQRPNTWTKPSRAGFANRGRGGPGNQNSERRPTRYDRGNDDFGARQDGGDRGFASNRETGARQRDGDWKCESCNNTNFAWRNACNRCKTAKPGDTEGSGGSAGYVSGGRQNNFGGENSRGSSGGRGSGFSRFNNSDHSGGRYNGGGSGGRDRGFSGPIHGRVDNNRSRPY